MRYAIEGKAVEIPTHSSNGVYSTLTVLYSLRSSAKNCSQEDIKNTIFMITIRVPMEPLLMILSQKLLTTTK